MRPSVRKLSILGLVVASCSTDRPMPSSPSTDASAGRPFATLSEGVVSGRAAGDVKVGNGTLDIDRVRMDRQSSRGVSVLRQYAQPGGVYPVNPGEIIELWVEFSGASNPRLRVDWGGGEPDSPDITGCGSCLLTHRYSSAGRFSVSVTLDDRVSTTVTRTFQLNVSPFNDTGSCGVLHSGTGCSNAACQAQICSTPLSGGVTPFPIEVTPPGVLIPAGFPLPAWPSGDSFCCTISWDGLCTIEAITYCR